jgi:hypothetical protein
MKNDLLFFTPAYSISPHILFFHPFGYMLIPFICQRFNKIVSLVSQHANRMNYTDKYFELKANFKLNGNTLKIDDSVEMLTMHFYSKDHLPQLIDESEDPSADMLNLGMPDHKFYNNNSFAYPIFVPKGKKKYSKAIVLLHGLNEKFWDKYLPWAYYLALYTNRPVILFPLSFHMNRAPGEWSDPRLMAPLVNNRKAKYQTDNLTFVNVALSSRLSDEPLRFMRSGYQSATDLIYLTNLIETGDFPLFQQGTKPDFFAYSIGAFVSQILLLANPYEMFTNSRFFLFCGGAFFKDMHGESKLIMDKTASEKLNEFYTATIDKVMYEKEFLRTFFIKDILGKAFYSMIKEENNKTFREDRINAASKNIFALALEKDKVIPSSGINTALHISNGVDKITETLDFPYIYNHENPFPVTGKYDKHTVDFWFTEVFEKAAGFFN